LINSFLTFGCYTSSSKQKNDSLKHIEGMGSIDNERKRTYNRSRYVREKNRGSGGPDNIQADNNHRKQNKVDSFSPALASVLTPPLMAELRSQVPKIS